MTCTVTPVAGGVVFACTRGVRRKEADRPSLCQACNRRPATVTCDYPAPHNESRTCDRLLCIDPRCCDHRQGERGGADYDFCRTHMEVSANA